MIQMLGHTICAMNKMWDPNADIECEINESINLHQLAVILLKTQRIQGWLKYASYNFYYDTTRLKIGNIIIP